MEKYEGSKFTKLITIDDAEGKFVFDGCDFTADARITIKNAASVVIKNCRFYDLTNPDKNTQIVEGLGTKCDEIIFENNYIGPGKVAEGEKLYIYDFFNMQITVKKGIVRNNYFAHGCCAKNAVNFYRCEDDSVFEIVGNYFSDSDQAFRPAMRDGHQNVMFKVYNNIYAKTGEEGTIYEVYNVAVLTQPSATTTMNGLTFDIKGNKLPKPEHLPFLLYIGSKDPVPTEDWMPTVIVEGKTLDVKEIPYCSNDCVIHYLGENEEEEVIEEPEEPVVEPDGEPEAPAADPEGEPVVEPEGELETEPEVTPEA